MTALADLPAAELRELAALADLRAQRRANNLEALLRGPALGAFAPGAPPSPPLLPQELESAMCTLAFRGWSGRGLFAWAEGYSAGRLAPEVITRVMNNVLRRRRRGDL